MGGSRLGTKEVFALSKVLFNHALEEKKTLEYVRNLINSFLLNSKPFELFYFASDVLGFEKTTRLLVKLHPDVKEVENIFEEHLIRNILPHHVPHKTMVLLLKTSILTLIEKRLQTLSSSKQCEIEKRFDVLKDTFKLTKEELEVLIFYYLYENGIVRDNFYNSRNLFDLSEFSMFMNYAHIVLGMRKSDISRVFSEGKLMKAYLLEKKHSNLVCITDWSQEYLLGLGKRSLNHKFYSTENDVSLELSDFDIPKEELMILETLIRSDTGNNILFYGVQGTGKTSLAKCLSKTYGKNLFTVKMPESNEHADRLSAIYATVHAAEKDASVILIDEADEVLNTDDSLFFRSRTSKSWINTLLEQHQKKIIWITNRVEAIHPSTMRRFSFSMEFKQFNEERRFKVLMHELKKEGLQGILAEEEIKEISRTYAVNAAGIISAISILNIEKNKNTDKGTILKKIKTVLKNHQRVTTGKHREVSKMTKDFSRYSLNFLNCSEDLEKITGILKRYIEIQAGGNVKVDIPMSMLFHGMSGTGKSEFVYYLGHILNKEVLLRRCSEVHSMFVGETEKNIASAFQDAQENNKILFFDEADSFLYPRQDASHSWEKSFTNEILTQLESFRGIVIFATNDIEGLDSASMRRFRFKVEFRPLTPQGVLEIYNTVLSPLIPVNENTSEDERSQLQAIRNLTVGDFAVVRDRHMFMNQNDITHTLLINALTHEASFRDSGKEDIGFRQCA
jgi:transitional endoplasmic reticulum ATPase